MKINVKNSDLTLKNRKIYIDMLQTFKIIRGFDDVKNITGFNIVGSGEQRLTRLTAHPLNLDALPI